MTPGPALSFTLDHPATFLHWLARGDQMLDLTSVTVAEMWSLVAIACCARAEQQNAPFLEKLQDSNTPRFAHAVGIEDVIHNSAGRPRTGEVGRTVSLVRVADESSVQPVAYEIAELAIPGDAHASARTTIGYVLVELLRNVLQHSNDSLGAVVGAQLNDRGRNAGNPMIQVAVADAGVGIPKALSRLHPTLRDASEALEKALWPHYSGTFGEGKTGSEENAGLGLFVISEMAKSVGGRLLIASRGATMLLEPGANPGEHRQRFVETPLGYDGTLVAFETPENLGEDFDSLFSRILEKAKERTPARSSNEVLRFDATPVNLQRFMVQPFNENITQARSLAETKLIPSIVRKTPAILDFRNVGAITQSFAHALLFEAMRVAWALGTPIYIVNARPAVRSALELVQAYAMGG